MIPTLRAVATAAIVKPLAVVKPLAAVRLLAVVRTLAPATMMRTLETQIAMILATPTNIMPIGTVSPKSSKNTMTRKLVKHEQIALGSWRE